MLIGLVTKNGILIVEFANQLKEKGMNVQQAIREAAAARLRPILMTSLATALGALPIAMALGAGSKSRMGMGIVVIGGLLFSLILKILPMFKPIISHSSNEKLMMYPSGNFSGLLITTSFINLVSTPKKTAHCISNIILLFEKKVAL